jgi:membrane-associated phospholipid phosphatase
MAGEKKYRNGRLTATDKITLLYIIITSFLLIAGISRLEHPGPHFLMRAMMVAFIGIILFLEQEYEGKWTRMLHALYPLLFLGYFFPETDYLNDLFLDVLDPAIIRMEMAVFGFMPSLAFSDCCPQPWFSEMMHAGYFSFYLIILFFAVYYFVKRPELFPRRMFGFFFAFYVFYLIFDLFPSAGPQYFFSPPANAVPPGYFITDLMNRILLFGDRPTGAFPSSHIGMTWLIMYFFFRDARRLFYLWLLPALILTFATVYIKAHYAVDVIGGFLMVPLLVWTGNKVWLLVRRQEIVAEKESVPESPVVPPMI